jgi:hypothetical protein
MLYIARLDLTNKTTNNNSHVHGLGAGIREPYPFQILFHLLNLWRWSYKEKDGKYIEVTNVLNADGNQEK